MTEQEWKDLFYDKSTYIGSKTKEIWVKKNIPILYNNIINYQYGNSYYEKFYLYLNQTMPNICECGNTNKFLTLREGYTKYCSRSCGNTSQSKKEKIKATCIEKYGSSSFFGSNIGKQTILEIVQTKYNINNISQLQEIKDKKIETCRENYGVDYYAQSDEGKNKIKQSFIDNHNVSSGFALQEKRNAVKRLEFLKEEAKSYDLEVIANHFNHIEYRCLISGDIFLLNKSTRKGRLKLGMSLNLIQYPLNDTTSQDQLEIYNWLRNYDDSFEMNNTLVLDGKELDLYSEKLKIAIEYNGLYWHSDVFKPADYHLDKTRKCEELGITLIHIFEDEWKFKKDIIKNIILSHLDYFNKLEFSNDELIKINSFDVEIFLNKNYLYDIDNYDNFSGFYINNELVYVQKVLDNNEIIWCVALNYSIDFREGFIIDRSKFPILINNYKLYDMNKYYVDCTNCVRSFDRRTSYICTIYDCGKYIIDDFNKIPLGISSDTNG